MYIIIPYVNLEVTELSNIFSRIIDGIKSLFGGKEKGVSEPESSAEGRSAVFLPEDRVNGSRNRRVHGKKAQENQKRTERPQKAEKTEKPQKGEKGGKPQNPQKVEKAAKAQKPQKASKPEAVAKPFDENWKVPARRPEKAGEVFFQDFELDRRIMKALLDDMGFRCCSPIQGQALPYALEGKDIAGKAQTGTGKTAAFLVTIIQRFLSHGREGREPWQPLAVILAPTRELAIQIANDAADISVYCPELHTVAVYGGMDYDRQMSELAADVDIVVATPGRLIDYLRKHAVDLSKVSIAVIDEADRMLDMGFIPDVKRIMAYLPKPEERQTMLFSATLSHDIMQLASRWMRPEIKVIEIDPEHVLADGIDETVYAVTTAEKIPVMLWLFKHEDCRRVIIFRNRKKDVEALHSVLERCGVQCEMLTGDVDQKKRLRILDEFRAGKVKIIVATDVAGRGIHVDDVTHVINYDLPYEAEDYVHRVGRTARAGHRGRAISFADEDCAFVIPEIEKIIERPLPITQPEDNMLVMPEKLKNISSARASGIHRSENHGGSTYRRSFGPRGRH